MLVLYVLFGYFIVTNFAVLLYLKKELNIYIYMHITLKVKQTNK